jgi:adenosine 3'-phospho 5'-phosphosulfate transporter B2
LVLSSAATIAQFFISYTIKAFGALLFATVMTTRQFLSILLSCFLFMHPLSMGQTLATGIVFGALYYKNLSLKKNEQPSKGLEGSKEPFHFEKVSQQLESQSALERLVAAGR